MSWCEDDYGLLKEIRNIFKGIDDSLKRIADALENSPLNAKKDDLPIDPDPNNARE